MKYFIPLLLLLTAISCSEKKSSSVAYFGGKILHPKSNNVVVFNHIKALDTIFLKDDNTFLGKIDSITEGLYYFKHGPEHQYIYLEPSDSLLLRLNTWDFDESLVYSGTNANKNNALIESFLQNEKEEKELYQLSKEEPKQFLSKVNQLLASKEKVLFDYKVHNPEDSKKFLDILEIAYKYPIYTEIEDYLINHKNSNKEVVLDENFFKHREKINMGLDSIMFFNAYSQYVMTRIYSDTYQQGFKKNSDKFTVALLKNIDKNIKSEDLKNNYLKYATIRHFYNKSSCEVNNDAFFIFFKLNSSIEDKKNVQRLLNDAKKVHKGNVLPEFEITDFAGVNHNIHKVAKRKNTVIYFRNPEHYSDEWVASRVNYLMDENPSVQFLIVNITDDKDYRVKNLDINKQFHLPINSTATSFLTSKYPRTILVKKNGTVANGFGALSSFKMNQQIADLQKN